MDFSQYPRLTALSKGSGCGCKIAPAVLEAILANPQSESRFDALLVGLETRDDAAVFKLNDQQALISTTDFFTPVVDDPVSFGKIAAANALSDVYAMGGRPLIALSVLGWPVDSLPAEMASEVLRGAREICARAGIPLAGGHSINAPEPFFGLAVTGMVHPEQLKQNSTAQAGDLIYLTKPLGIGIAAAAFKRGLSTTEEFQEAVIQMETLNDSGFLWAQYPWIHAMTDITGFGLLGHLKECCGTELGAEIWFSAVPILETARRHGAGFVFPDNTWRNWNAVESFVALEEGEAMGYLADPQTNGGLLLAVHPGHQEEFEALYQKTFPDMKPVAIGRFTAETGIRVRK